MAWLASVAASVLEWLLQVLVKDVYAWWVNYQADKAQKEAEAKQAAAYQAIIDNPNSTEEERKAAADALLNHK